MRTRRQQTSSDPVQQPQHRSPLNVEHSTGHTPVLLHESLELLRIQSEDVVLDATLGGAGHARAIVDRLGEKGTFIGVDADMEAVARSREMLKGARAKVILIEGNFRDVESYLGKHGIPYLTKALFDLGWSIDQLSAGRGFSFLSDEPLLMTFSGTIRGDTLTAGKIVNTWEEESIADILYGWGEEKFSRRIARAIVEARRQKEIRTSKELGAIVQAAVPAFYRRGRIHPATKTFQALRIAVNDEIGALKQGMQSAWKSLRPRGRLACIAFHSVEDRVIKQTMREWSHSGQGVLVTKKPIRPTRGEILGNPRSRSAKLRCIRKL